MDNTDIAFIRALVQMVSSGAGTYSRDTLSRCYFDDLARRGVVEVPAVSQKWIDYYWKRLGSVFFEHLSKVSRSDEKLVRFLIETLGK